MESVAPTIPGRLIKRARERWGSLCSRFALALTLSGASHPSLRGGGSDRPGRLFAVFYGWFRARERGDKLFAVVMVRRIPHSPYQAAKSRPVERPPPRSGGPSPACVSAKQTKTRGQNINQPNAPGDNPAHSALSVSGGGGEEPPAPDGAPPSHKKGERRQSRPRERKIKQVRPIAQRAFVVCVQSDQECVCANEYSPASPQRVPHR